jgi:8-oxo-dGTP pyrophosphatase MutT (NUDIX family)
METTRHFTATVYVVEGGETLLHDHKRLDAWLPPGGHVDRGELPHETARREAREETGLDLELVVETEDIASPTARSLPKPRHLQLADVNVCDGEVGHQHVDFVYYGRVESRDIDPADGEAPVGAWEWVTADELAADGDRFAADVREAGRRAIRAVETATE